MRQLILACGSAVLLDDADFDRISAYRWHLSHNGYAIRRIREKSGKKQVVYLHREVFRTSDDVDVDHADGNKLNNTRGNLRAASRSLNNANSTFRGGSSEFKGVAWHRRIQRWVSYIKVNGKRIHLGSFVDEVLAAKSYNTAARQHFGEFARLNPV